MARLGLFASVSLLALASVGLLASGVHQSLSASPTGDLGQDVVAVGAAPAPDQAPASQDLADLPAASGMRFGIDAASVDLFEQQAGAPDYATVWVGKWNLDSGWRDTDSALQRLRTEGVTPAVHFYYWGDDIKASCFSEGCNGKDQAGWDRLEQELAQHLQSDLAGAPVLILLESEFNKGGVHQSEDLDGRLADKAMQLHSGYPAAKVVLALGNWWPDAWGTWDRAAAASDYVGLQALAGSTRDDEATQLDLANRTLAGVDRLRQLFGKPVVVQDVAVSSYPEPDHLATQEEALARFAERLPDLQQAGVEAVIYRSFVDVPDMALGNHYAEAERHWGLAWHDSKELKPAGQAWMTAVEKARGLEGGDGEAGHQGEGGGAGGRPGGGH